VIAANRLLLITAICLVACTAAPVASPATPDSSTSTDLPTPSPATDDCTYTVSPLGDDANPGSRQQPWATFQYAADTAVPGEVVCFRSGNYLTYETHLTRSGTPDAWITFRAALEEHPMLLNAQDNAVNLITLDPGVSFIRISGFRLEGFALWGIFVAGGNYHVRLDHLEISGGEAGVRLTLGNSGEPPANGPVRYITFEDSVVKNPIYTAVDCTPGPCDTMVLQRLDISGTGMASGEASYGADGIAVERGSDILVADNTIHDNAGDGIDLNSRDTDGVEGSNRVVYNRVYRNHLQAVKLWAGGIIGNNDIWGQGSNPVMIGSYPGVTVVLNNTIAYNMWDSAFAGRDYALVAAYPEEGQPPAKIELTLTDNIFAFNTGPEVGTPTGIYLGAGVTLVSESGNVFFSRDDCEIEAAFVTGRDPCFTQDEIRGGVWGKISGQGVDDLAVDPMFTAGWPDVDVRLLPGSPAVGSGASLP